MRVILVDDHAIVRQGLRALLEKKSFAEIVGEAGDAPTALSLVEELEPDIVVLDIVLPGMSGLEVARKVKEMSPKTRVIILSMHGENVYVYRALRAGVSGYVLKDAAYEELKLAMEAVSRGENYLSSAVSRVVIQGYLNSYPDPVSKALSVYEGLTPREKEIFCLLVGGQSRQEIAEQLYISPKTVDRHRENLKKKLELKQESDFLHFARLTGMVEY